MKTKTVILIACISMGFNWTAFSQLDPLYSQYLFNQSMINPAYTGINEVFNATVISRQQWIGVEGAPSTNYLNASTSFVKGKVGAGLQVLNDKYGINSNTEAYMMYAYKIQMLNQRSLSFGLQAGIINYNFDFSRLNLEQPDPSLQSSNASTTHKNFGVGIFFKTRHYYLGASIPRILNTDVLNGTDNPRYKRHIYLSAGYLFDQLTFFKLKPSVLLRIVEGQEDIIDLNAHFLLKEVIWAGLTLRNFSTIGLNGQFELSNFLRLGYTVELPFNEIDNTDFSTHELMVSIDLGIFKHQVVGRRYF